MFEGVGDADECHSCSYEYYGCHKKKAPDGDLCYEHVRAAEELESRCRACHMTDHNISPGEDWQLGGLCRSCFDDELHDEMDAEGVDDVTKLYRNRKVREMLDGI